MNTRAQLSIEFIVLLVIVLGAIILLLVGMQSRQQQLQTAELDVLANQLLDEVAYSIWHVQMLGEQASMQVYIPNTVQSREFTLTIHNQSRLLTLFTGDFVYQRPITTGAFVSVDFITGRLYTVTNTEGRIVFS
ncbi:MAG: hypothetical protein ACMXYE_03105 [Candidatus Woesearchaeota archaeon]